MRLRVSLLVVATSSLVLVSFLVPLALVLRTLATDRAVSAATAEAQSLAPLVTTLEVGSLRLTVDQVNAGDQHPGHGFPAVRHRTRPARGCLAGGAGWLATAAASPPRHRPANRSWWPWGACPAAPPSSVRSCRARCCGTG